MVFPWKLLAYHSMHSINRPAVDHALGAVRGQAYLPVFGSLRHSFLRPLGSLFSRATRRLTVYILPMCKWSLDDVACHVTGRRATENLMLPDDRLFLMDSSTALRCTWNDNEPQSFRPSVASGEICQDRETLGRPHGAAPTIPHASIGRRSRGATKMARADERPGHRVSYCSVTKLNLRAVDGVVRRL